MPSQSLLSPTETSKHDDTMSHSHCSIPSPRSPMLCQNMSLVSEPYKKKHLTTPSRQQIFATMKILPLIPGTFSNLQFVSPMPKYPAVASHNVVSGLKDPNSEPHSSRFATSKGKDDMLSFCIWTLDRYPPHPISADPSTSQ